MIILHVTKKYPKAIGGDATCVFNLEKEQEKRGHKVFILASNCRDIVNKSNIYKFGLRDISSNWDRVTFNRIFSLLLLFGKSIFVLSKTKPDIIHSHSADLGFIISIWAKLKGIPVINTCHGVTFPFKFLSKAKRYAELFFLRWGFFSKIITVDANSVDSFREYRLKNYEYAHMLGVDQDEFAKIKERIFVSQKHRYIKLIFVGRIDPLKKLDCIIKAAGQLKEFLGYFEVWIIGDGPCKEDLIKLSRELNVDKNIKFFKAITNKERLIKMYCLADIFVLPSIWEGFPLVILEAWAAGLAVIATEVGGITAVCKNGENALLIPPNDTGALVNSILTLNKDVNLRDKISNNGQKIVKEKYGWDIIAAKLDDVYRRVLH